MKKLLVLYSFLLLSFVSLFTYPTTVQATFPSCPTGENWTRKYATIRYPHSVSYSAPTGYIITEICAETLTLRAFYTSDYANECLSISGITTQNGRVQNERRLFCPNITRASFKIALIEEETIDMCSNLEGTQEGIPDGYEQTEDNQCLPTQAPTPTPNTCNTATTSIQNETLVENDCEIEPTPTPSSEPTPEAIPKKESKPKVTNDLDVAYNCQNNRWETKLTLKKKDKPIFNAKIDYEYKNFKITDYSNHDGKSEVNFQDNGEDKLKVYIDSFSGHEVTLKKPHCEAKEPQAASSGQGEILGTSTEPLVYANTGSTFIKVAQILFSISVLIAYLIDRKSQHSHHG